MALLEMSITFVLWFGIAVMLKMIEQYTVPPFPWDVSILRFAHGLRSLCLDRIFRLITLLGSFFILTPVTALMVWMLSEAGRTGDACLLALDFTGASLIANGIKHFFKRKRPAMFPSIGDSPSDPSFPSAHSAQIIAFIVPLYWIFMPVGTLNVILICTAAVLVVILVASSRIYLQVHYPSDVFAGIMLALLWVTGADNLLSALSIRASS